MNTPMSIGGRRIIVSPHAVVDTETRLFPASRHRSKRIHKKLVRRHGGEFTKKPCIYETPQGIIVHPALLPELRRRLERL